ncbi:MAG: cytochrome c [Acidobacteria bacterium]|nr:cytochrome c [Acidobacteriota bacterium]
MRKTLTWLAVMLLPLVVCGGIYLLGREVTVRNREWTTQMQYSPAYLSQTTNPVLPNHMTGQMPIAGTIARGYQPFHYGASENEAARAGRELKNPFAATVENLARGQYVFANYCAVCHGASGGGDGAIIPKYPNPPSYKTETSKNVPDGAMFHAITLGRKDMPAHAAQVGVDDRWKVILYIRQLQGK